MREAIMIAHLETMVPYLSVLAVFVALVILAAALEVPEREVPKNQAKPKLAPTTDLASAEAADAKPVTPRVVFLLDSLLATSLFRYTMSQGMDEVFCYIAGVRLAPDRVVLQHIVAVAHAYQSPGGARADAVSTIGVHDMLDDLGVPIVAHCHSHPGSGPGGTRPSDTDRKYVADLAAGSSRLLGLIFARDGYVRAYAHDGFDFEVEIFGNGIRKVQEHDNVFHIDSHVGHGELPLALFGAPGRAARASSPGQATGV
jgi:hypothetical protein